MKEEEEVKPFVSPGKAFPDVIFEQTSNNTYLVYSRSEEKFIVKNSPWYVFEHKGVKYIPLSRVPWPTAYLPKDYESEERLFNRIRDFFIAHLDVANELFYDVYAAFVMASWRPEDFTVVPYLFFLGPLASGKTRALECFHRLCYRSIMATSMSAASLFRALEAWHPTLLLDETEVYHRKEMVEVVALLNSGYRRGQYAIRIEKIEEGCPQIAMFDTFGFKVLAGTEELAATLQSRCIITTMSKAVRPVNLFIDEEKAQELRDMLLMYRFRNLGKNTEPHNPHSFLQNGFFQNARVIELFVSLLHVSPADAIKEKLVECMKQITQSRLDEEQASIEARVFDAVLSCEHKVEKGKISTRAITEAFNEGLPEKEQVNSSFIGRKVSALGFEKCRLTGGVSGYFWDSKLVERLRKRYYPSASGVPSLPSQPSLPSLTMVNSACAQQTVSEESEGKLPQTSDRVAENSIKSEGSERSEESEGVLEVVPKPSMEPFVKPEDLKSVYWSDGFYDWHPCAVCGYTKLTSWKGETFKGEQVWICEDCKEEWEKQRG